MCSSVSLRDFINDNKPLILDGGLATQLEAQGFDLGGDPLWSARLLHTNPEAIQDVHYSGSDVITTATYQASVEGFVQHLGVTCDRARELLMSGVHVAKHTLQKFISENKTGRIHGLVAGSTGPFGAFLHDGSEYTGNYAKEMSVEDLKSWHRPQVECLTAAGADIIAFETIPSIKEAEALVQLLREFPNSKAWLSFSCKDEKCISDGSLFSDAVQVALKCPQLVAIGVNCCSPDLVEPVLDSAKTLLTPDLSWVVYPNTGEEWDSQKGWLAQVKKAGSLSQFCESWMRQGAAFIGGCCRIGPIQITELRNVLKGPTQ
ncbi:homocysteine S-methyltransferase isoform X2 [Boleophthalmus pectinirostris]|uniref:homocysteine S-methyltransferase isoform X2 n=1 Tax=Boleophthalmus pectinirostris TaxID=150288 RepID=UPI002431B16B|nr:homocysteine S-methyltransferase isoform X2 [Boleophthalmus pectinirostris]